jgi:hypothetical protein
MNMNETLRSLRACDSAIAWSQTQPDAATAWSSCERGDWLLWLAKRVGFDRARLVQAACACARQALQYIPAGEDRPRLAIETAEAWARGEAALADVRRAADAASVYANVTTAAYAANAATHAADAAAAAANAAYAAYAAAAADAADAAADAAASAAAAAATTHAADADAADANAAYAAAGAANAAAYAAANAPTANAARKITLRRCADLIRERITWADIEATRQSVVVAFQ